MSECSDEIKNDLKFVMGEFSGSVYTSSSFRDDERLDGKKIVFLTKTTEGTARETSYTMLPGYYKISRSTSTSGTAYYTATYLGDSYKVNICSDCGDYYIEE